MKGSVIHRKARRIAALAVSIVCAAACTFVAAPQAALPRPLVRAGFRFWHDVRYGEREDLKDEGAGFRGKIGNWTSANTGTRICRHCTGQRMDVYVPDSYKNGKAVVVMYIHGGTWSHCFDKGAIPSDLFMEFMRRGVVLASPNYILQPDLTMNVTDALRPEATFEAMLRDIDLAVSRLGDVLADIGVEMGEFVMAGESAGAHLALLYAYDQDAPEKLALGLSHKVRISRIVDIVGPTDFLAFGDNMKTPTAKLSDKDPRKSIRILIKRLVGMADDAPDADMIPLVAKWSPVNLVTTRSVPTMMAYGQLMPLVKTDGIIPVEQKSVLERRLGKAGVKFESRVFMGSNHGKVSNNGAEWIVRKALGK